LYYQHIYIKGILMPSEAQVILSRIKKLTRVLQKTEMFSTDPVAQKLNAKFTGLLGKLSSYVNQNTAEPTPDANAPKVDAQSPTRPQAPQGEKVPARSEAKLREHIRNLIINELTDAEKEEQKAELENQVSDLQGQVAKLSADAAKKKEPLQKKIADLQKQKEKIAKMATK
jgi:hypothetical protein